MHEWIHYREWLVPSAARGLCGALMRVSGVSSINSDAEVTSLHLCRRPGGRSCSASADGCRGVRAATWLVQNSHYHFLSRDAFKDTSEIQSGICHRLYTLLYFIIYWIHCYKLLNGKYDMCPLIQSPFLHAPGAPASNFYNFNILYVQYCLNCTYTVNPVYTISSIALLKIYKDYLILE